MSVLLLRLEGPLQAWGDSSRFTRRTTRREPTKSAIVGMIASAMGRSREDPIDDLAALEMAVRIDQPGALVRDFQTEVPRGKMAPLPLSHRYYLADAKFVVALAGDDNVLELARTALSRPSRPLYLGRRACPLSTPVVWTMLDEENDVRTALTMADWIAAPHVKRQLHHAPLEVICDAREGERCTYQPDIPLSFSASGRRYADRAVTRFVVANPEDAGADAAEDAPRKPLDETHDPFDLL